MFFLAKLPAVDSFDAGVETLETRLFKPEDIPWDDIAFSAVKYVLEKWVEVGSDYSGSVFTETFQKISDGY